MKSIVLYSTKSGNTEKVAKAIADELTCPCVKVTPNYDVFSLDLDAYDIVFIGTGIYKGQPHQDLLHYLQTANIKGKKQFALFMTCFGWGKGIADRNVIDTLTDALQSKGQRLLANHYSCFGGGLGFVKRGHPDKQELDEAKAWARALTKTNER
jgi:flavodoxin